MIFVLDTNVLSAIMGGRPAPDDALLTTTICQAEILSGLAVMPEGRRRSALETAARGVFTADFGGRGLPFNTAAAEAFSRSTGAPAARPRRSIS